MNYEPLFARRPVGMRLGLEIVEPVFRALGTPGAQRPAIHVVGTNGKGSIAAMAAHALHEHGLSVGLYTSPHLERVEERVRVDGEPVSEHELEQAISAVLAAEQQLELPRELSFFEILTLAALVAFEARAPDVLVVEAGLGGRLDATRIVNAKAVAFGSIAMDHEAYLGSTLAAIAAEKAAVMRPGVPAFTAIQAPEAMAVLQARAHAVDCPLHVVPPCDFAPNTLPGEHQRSNGAVALGAARVFVPELEPSALAGVRWPGRLEVVCVGEGRVVFDVAHNPAGIDAVVRWLETQLSALAQPWVVLFAAQPDKDRTEMRRHLARLSASGARASLWSVPLPGLPAENLAGDRTFAGLDDPHLHGAIFEHIGGGGTLIVCGSHVLVGAMRGLIRDGVLKTPDDQDPRGTFAR